MAIEKEFESLRQTGAVNKKRSRPLPIHFVFYGGPEEIRTLDLSDANRTLSQSGKFSANGLRYMVCRKCYQTMRVKMGRGAEEFEAEEKMWALRKPILDAHIFALQEKIQKLELEIGGIVIEKITCQI